MYGVTSDELPQHHRPDGTFRNPWPDAEPHTFKEFLRWKVAERRNRAALDGPPVSFNRSEPTIIAPRADRGYRSVTWVGHSTVLLQVGPLNVLTDPVWSDRASPFRRVGPRRIMPPGVAFESLPPIDLVLLSHNHYDHLDAPTVRRLAATHRRATWLCPLRLGARLRRFGAEHVIECAASGVRCDRQLDARPRGDARAEAVIQAAATREIPTR